MDSSDDEIHDFSFRLGNFVKHLHLTVINHVLSGGSVMLNMNNWIVMLVIFVILK